MEQWPKPCEIAMKMIYHKEINLQEIINHIKNCSQCQQIIPFIKTEIEKSLEKENKQNLFS